MFIMLGNLTKAAISVAVTPITVVADVVMLIPDSEDRSKPMPFSRTGKMLKNAGDNLDTAVDPTDI